MSLTKNPNRNVVNFAAGPSALPYEVLETAQREMLDFAGLGVSVMEISHRSAAFSKIINQAEINVRELLNVPQNYKILFLQGGGNGQFCAVPLNLINRRGKKSADYAVTGYWSDRAALEAKKYGNVNLVFPKLDKFDHIPPVEQWNVDPEASYLFICENETIHGVEYPSIEAVRRVAGDVPIVSDCSSNLFTRPVDISQYGCIFAGAQKNFGPAGVTMVIIREDLLGFQLPECPSIFDFKLQAGQGSLFQTPPTYGIYICGLVFEWLKKQGGIESIGKVNRMKADLLYETIDNSNGFFLSPINKSDRSRVTIPFRINGKDGKPSEQLEKEFIQEGEKQLLRELKGHRSVGGIRAAIFNAISYEEVQLLVKFMHEFKQKHSA